MSTHEPDFSVGFPLGRTFGRAREWGEWMSSQMNANKKAQDGLDEKQEKNDAGFQVYCFQEVVCVCRGRSPSDLG